ncbi:MAG: imidazole glycerol phosphate synthase subunit HisH [Alphaproteobacteria bacterium]|nr:imidazole glycerol phosphate synthase subunit HisH [Alphaproteobacteria bacterium]
MTTHTTLIIDYGSGNLRSAARAFERVIADEGLRAEVVVSNRAEDVAKADRIVLPGQGAFGDCIDNLRATPGMIEALEEAVLERARPFLGICVGMQLLATRGLEHGNHEGLDWIPGQVTALADHIPAGTLKIPHMGWNEVFVPPDAVKDEQNIVLRSVESWGTQGEHFYFVHSFMFECKDKRHILGAVDYGSAFPAIVGRDNIMGVQFHPEKSQSAGLKLIGDFMRWDP